MLVGSRSTYSKPSTFWCLIFSLSLSVSMPLNLSPMVPVRLENLSLMFGFDSVWVSCCREGWMLADEGVGVIFASLVMVEINYLSREAN